MDNLNRTDRRELIKKAKKKSEFAKKLTPLQKEYINDLVQAGVERTRVKLLDTFDLCVQGALIETTNLTYEDIGKVVYKAGELMKESYDILENMSLEERRMSVKSIKNEVAEKITKMIFDGVERKEIVKVIRDQYKGTGLTTPEINIFYKQGKEAFDKFVKSENLKVEKSENIAKSIKDGDIDKAVDYILEESKPLKEKKATKKAEKVETVKEEVQAAKESKFKVTNKVVKVVEADITGEHGEYHIKNGVVEIKDVNCTFNNEETLKSWTSKERERITQMLNALNSLEGEALEVMKEFA